MAPIWIFAGVCGAIAAVCLIAMGIINLATMAEGWYRQAERLRKWPVR